MAEPLINPLKNWERKEITHGDHAAFGLWKKDDEIIDTLNQLIKVVGKLYTKVYKKPFEKKVSYSVK